MKIATLDIETTNFAAIGPGMLICTVIKPLDEEPKTFRYDQYHCRLFHERDLVRAVVNEASKYDMIITFYGNRFDFRWIMSRCIALDLPFNFSPLSYDLWEAAHRLGLKTPPGFNGHPRCSLGDVADFLGLPQGKTRIYTREWWNSIIGDNKIRKEKLEEVVSHCVEDTRLSEQIYKRILPLDKRATIRRWSV